MKIYQKKISLAARWVGGIGLLCLGLLAGAAATSVGASATPVDASATPVDASATPVDASATPVDASATSVGASAGQAAQPVDVALAPLEPAAASYQKITHRLTENAIDDEIPVAIYNPKRGQFLVVWDACQAPDDCTILASHTDVTGQPVGSPITITTGVTGSLVGIAYNSDYNEYLVAYMRYTSLWSLYGRIILADGELYGSEILIEENGVIPYQAAIAFNPTAINDNNPGEYLVVYDYPTATNWQILARHIGSWGNVDASPHVIAESANIDERNFSPDVAYNPERNEYLVSYNQMMNLTPLQYDVLARRFDAAANPLGAVIEVAIGGSDAFWPDLAIGQDEYLITWTDGTAQGAWAGDIYGRHVSGEGIPNSAGFEISDCDPSFACGGRSSTAYQFGYAFLVVWEQSDDDQRNSANVLGRYLPGGSASPGEIFGVDETPYAQFHANLACDGRSGCLVSESDESYLAGASSEVTLLNIHPDWLYLPLVIR